MKQFKHEFCSDNVELSDLEHYEFIITISISKNSLSSQH